MSDDTRFAVISEEYVKKLKDREKDFSLEYIYNVMNVLESPRRFYRGIQRRPSGGIYENW